MNITGATLEAKFTSTGTATHGSSTSQSPIVRNFSASFTNGTGADNANQHYSAADAALAASTTATFDLAGVLTDAFGATITFARVKGLLIKNTGTVNLTIAGTCTALGGASLTLRPGGILFIIAPDATAYAVAGGSTDTVTILNTSGAAVAGYDLTVIGVV